MKKFKIGFIGTGNIATAIFTGITSSGYIKSNKVCVFDALPQKAESFTSCGCVCLNSAEEVALNSDYVFLTVKPQVYPELLSSIKNACRNCCLIDVAAGVSISFVKECLGFDAHVVRVMPNTPLMYGFGSSALVKADPVSDDEFDFVKGCFESCGVTSVVDESLINTVTAVSGSAPAYIMRFAKDFIDYAISSGMDSTDAAKLVLQTFIGSAEMIKKSESTVEELISMVTSPNGTTAAGLASLSENCFDDTVKLCLEATVRRSKELSK